MKYQSSKLDKKQAEHMPYIISPLLWHFLVAIFILEGNEFWDTSKESYFLHLVRK